MKKNIIELDKKIPLKNRIEEPGMDLACALLDIICALKTALGDFKIPSFRWWIFCLLDSCEYFPHKLFGYFYNGSQEEVDAALGEEYGEELSTYNIYQQALIILNRASNY